ncbi:MAG: phosphoribosylformylglycinamidine synthase subunit PurQ, partial [Verrucomicrobiota bacterium]|nr:phosphoribosylformylglycinamidine synthase subunit PurQ [Verrucomicrobiota bacterium]
ASHNSPFTGQIPEDKNLRIPIAHGEGNYFCDDETLQSLEDNDQVLFQYVDAEGDLTDHANPNGSRANIAGICNEKRNVGGMMPHPERASEAVLGGDDGRLIFQSLITALKNQPTLA